MMNKRHKELLEQGNDLFGKRGSLMSLWQETAENFYPERADFTVGRSLGEEFADHLVSSYPLLVRRDLGNSLGAMLRPTSLDWFNTSVSRDDRLDNEGKEWLEWATGLQRRAMYDRDARLRVAANQGDHDYATFGQCVLSAEFNRNKNALLYRNWHLRDVAWQEGSDGAIDTVHRKWSPDARTLVRLFPKTVTQTTKNMAEKTPFQTVNCRHIVVASDVYEGKWRTPFVSIYIDTDHQEVLEEVGIWTRHYIIPRWQTVSGSQYAYSPATVVGLPDARLIQSITLSLLDAGAKAASPPMIATRDALKSNIDIQDGGVTFVDMDYDERLGDALRPLTQDTRNLGFGVQMAQDTRSMLAEAFYLTKLTLPPVGGDMTAFEVGQRVQEYIRQALPLFEPIEDEYNGALCDDTFELLMRNGAYGDPRNIPESVQGQNVKFQFESPLHEATEKKKGQKFLEAKAMIAQAVEMDPSSAHIIDSTTALRDVLDGIRVPAKWVKSEEDVARIRQEEAQRQMSQDLLQSMSDGAEVTRQIGEAGQSLQAMDG